jgi:predicted phage tail component-like protein
MFTFNGSTLASFGCIGERIGRPGTGTRAAVLHQVPGRVGAYDMGVLSGERVIEFDLTLVDQASLAAARSAERAIAAWLVTDSPCTLMIDDETDVTYSARLDGSIEWEWIGATARRATITFTCPDPLATSTAGEVTTALASGITTVTNDGTAPAYPRITVAMESDCTYLRVDCNGRKVQLGNIGDPDATVIDVETDAVTDDLLSVTGWSLSETTPVEVGTVGGAMGADGANGFSPQRTGGSWPNDASWSGPIARHTTAHAAIAGDFKASERLYINDAGGGIGWGVAQVYRLDGSNNILSRAQIWTQAGTVRARVDLGGTGGEAIVLDKTLTVNALPEPVSFLIDVTRSGNVWTASVVSLDATGRRAYPTATGRYTDTASDFAADVENRQVRIARYHDMDAPTHIDIRSLSIVSLTTPGPLAVVTLPTNGKTVVIDCGADGPPCVYMDATGGPIGMTRWMDYWSLTAGNNWLALPSGSWPLSRMSDGTIGDAYCYHTERFL